MAASNKKPDGIDVQIGANIRLRRSMLGMSQKQLADSLGISFQQLQKYEKGTNRIGAGRLHAVSQVLGVPISFFFETASHFGLQDDATEMDSDFKKLADLMSSTEGLRLARSFANICNDDVRRSITGLVAAIENQHVRAESHHVRSVPL